MHIYLLMVRYTISYIDVAISLLCGVWIKLHASTVGIFFCTPQ